MAHRICKSASSALFSLPRRRFPWKIIPQGLAGDAAPFVSSILGRPVSPVLMFRVQTAAPALWKHSYPCKTLKTTALRRQIDRGAALRAPINSTCASISHTAGPEPNTAPSLSAAPPGCAGRIRWVPTVLDSGCCTAQYALLPAIPVRTRPLAHKYQRCIPPLLRVRSASHTRMLPDMSFRTVASRSRYPLPAQHAQGLFFCLFRHSYFSPSRFCSHAHNCINTLSQFLLIINICTII